MAKVPKAHASALRKLIRQFPTPEEMRAAYGAMRIHADRGVAIVAGAQLDFMLVAALANKMRPLDDDDFQFLFGESGPFGTTSEKIHTAYAVGIIGKQSKSEMVTLQLIRNVFAHSTVPISFDTKEISDVCESLDTMNLFPDYSDQKIYKNKDFGWTSPKSKYKTAIRIYTEELMRYIHDTTHGRKDFSGGLATIAFGRMPLP